MAGEPIDYDALITGLVHQVDAKMEEIRGTVKSISQIIKERQGLEADKAAAKGAQADG